MKKHLVPVLFILLLGGCKNKEEFKTVPKEKFCLDEKTSSIIEIKKTEKQAVTERIHLTEQIEFDSHKLVQFVRLVDGVISNSYFTLGDVVTDGQLLAEMQVSALCALQAELRSLEAHI